MLNKFFNFLKGYVIILLSGGNSERFINICLKRQIPVWGIKRRGVDMEIRVYRKDFKRLISVRRKTRIKLRIVKKVRFLESAMRYKKRFAFFMCACLAGVSVYWSSQYIWAVEINGVKNADIAEIAALLEENGVYVGALKKHMPPTEEIKSNVLAGCDELAWLWVHTEGSKARVEVSERRVPPNIVDRTRASDIVSVSDGVIKKVTVKLGDALVKSGDAVSRGDVLVSGKVRAYREGDPENYLYVHSLGEISAYTMRSAQKSEKLYDETRVPTGSVKRYITLELFGKKYELFKEKNTVYDDYDIKTDCYELTLPVLKYTGIAVTSEKHIAVITDRVEISSDIALTRAKDALEEQIAKELPPLSEKISERVEYDMTDDETITVKCVMSFIENIGTEEIIRSEEFDQQTN